MAPPPLTLPPPGAQRDRPSGFYPRAPRVWPCQYRSAADEASRNGWVHHLSPRGLTLYVDRDCLPGQTIEVLLLNPQATYLLRLSITVTRCDPLAGGYWLVAGAFPEILSPQEIRPFLT